MNLKRHIGLFMVNHIFKGVKFFSIKRKLLNFAGYSIGDHTKIVGPIYCTGKLSIGENCWIGTHCTIHGNGTVVLEDNIDIGPDVMFLTGGHQIGEENRRAGKGEKYSIKVESGCWIGARSTIVGNTTIRRSSVIGACSLVNKDVEASVLAGGIPCKTIKSL